MGDKDEGHSKRLVSVLIAGSTRDASSPPLRSTSASGDYENAVARLFEDLTDKHTWWEPEAQVLLAINSIRMEDRTLLMLDNGNYAIGPRTSQPDDIVVALLGCRRPIMLTRKADGTFRVIGPAYCENITHGELFLGPIVAPFEPIAVRGPHHHYVRAFRDLVTGHVQWEDPRLQNVKLPANWQAIPSIDGLDSAYYGDQNTGTSQWQDPRNCAEALEARGIKLESFALV